MKTISFLIVLFLLSDLSAQMVLHDPVSTRTFSTQKYADINGSPFLFDKWIKGSVTTEKGLYNELELKLNIYENTLIFNKNGEAYEFKEEVYNFVLKPNEDSATYQYYKKNIPSRDIKENKYVQIIAEGKINLYRVDSKLLSEINEINRGIIKTFSPVTKYFLSTDEGWQQIKPNKKAILAAVEDEKEKVETYVNENKLTINNDINLSRVIKYYNSLKKSENNN